MYDKHCFQKISNVFITQEVFPMNIVIGVSNEMQI